MSFRDRYQLMGKTIGGRRLKIVFQLKPNHVVRIIEAGVDKWVERIVRERVELEELAFAQAEKKLAS